MCQVSCDLFLSPPPPPPTLTPSLSLFSCPSQLPMEQPLLQGREKNDQEKKWFAYQNMGRTVPVINTASLPSADVSVEEIRLAASHSDSLYPPSLHAPLINSPEPEPPSFLNPSGQALMYQGGHVGDFGRDVSNFQSHALDEVEIRELLIDHVGHRCCWGSRPARSWNIEMVEDCNVYMGTLDTFVEKREIIKEREPYLGGKIDGKENGHELGLWELDLRAQFPVLFIPDKETRIKVPHSDIIEKCAGCEGRGDIVCPTCNNDQEPGYYKENHMTSCPSCYGRGLIAHRDGSDTICKKCNGKGKIACVSCNSRGLLKCKICQGSGFLLARSVAIIRWRTLSVRKALAAKGAASVPDEVFDRAKGMQLCNMQAYQCTPAFFADSYFLNRFSSEVIADRAPVPPTARVICERHTISVVPVTRVSMAHRGQSFNFYIIGFSREVYLKDNYPAQFCWGLCPCLEWLRL